MRTWAYCFKLFRTLATLSILVHSCLIRTSLPFVQIMSKRERKRKRERENEKEKEKNREKEGEEKRRPCSYYLVFTICCILSQMKRSSLACSFSLLILHIRTCNHLSCKDDVSDNFSFSVLSAVQMTWSSSPSFSLSVSLCLSLSVYLSCCNCCCKRTHMLLFSWQMTHNGPSTTMSPGHNY